MLCLNHPETDPFWNLAAEEYLLRQSREDVFMLWRNRSAIIVGRNQNTQAQVSAAFVDRHRVPVVRRLSGGGAVYHDLGNINFTFIKTGTPCCSIDFRSFLEPVLAFLREAGIAAELDGRNDVCLNGRKISGNAQYLHDGKVLHHGTLLFDVDLKMLEEALTVDPAKYRDRGVVSVRRRVTNIREHLRRDCQSEDFLAELLDHVRRRYGARRAEFSAADRKAIEAIADGRYRRWEWNFGHSPAYNFQRTLRTGAGTLDLRLHVADGCIQALRIFGDYFGRREVGELERAFLGCRHRREDLMEKVAHLPIADYIQGLGPDELVNALF